MCISKLGNLVLILRLFHYIKMHSDQQEIDCYEHNDPKLIYISENIPTTDTNIAFNEQFCKGCDCINLCKVEYNCQCLHKSGAIYEFTLELENVTSYKIKIRNANYPIYECNDNCKCSRFCGNRLVQFGPRKGLLIQKCKSSSGKTKGFGLVSTTYITKGNFICEYAGEVIAKDEALRRHSFNKKHNLMNFIFCVNEEFGNTRITTFIDPSTLGNIGRYINHSCEPNCDLFIVRVNNTVPKVCIFAKEDVSAGCELTFDYGSTNATNAIEGQRLVECLCESNSCKAFMPFHTYF